MLSNAFKFTERGSVTLNIDVAREGWSYDNTTLNRAEIVIAFSIHDSGIGIPVNRQRLIFEAFQQADGTTSRRYGGTGLGLSISREIASLLGGQIQLTSQPGVGSVFTFYIPQSYDVPVAQLRPLLQSGNDSDASDSQSEDDDEGQNAVNQSVAGRKNSVTQHLLVDVAAPFNDDRDTVQQQDQVLLIVEDDPNFASILLDMARERGFKGIVASSGAAVIPLSRKYRPAAITLDIGLQDVDGWTVLDRLKHSHDVSHIPVHIISGAEDTVRGLRQGALAFLHKPASKEDVDLALDRIKVFVDRKVKRLLIVEDNEVQRSSILNLIGNGDVSTVAVGSGEEALKALNAEHFDCMVLDLGLPDMSGFDLMERIRKIGKLRDLPIIIYTGKDLTRKQELELRKLADSIIVKDVKSPERLLDETTLFLHRVQENLPLTQQDILEQVRMSDPVLTGKHILVVDDDIRNIFALTRL